MNAHNFYDHGRLSQAALQTVLTTASLAAPAVPLAYYQRHTIVVQGDGSANGSHDVKIELDTAGANQLFPEGTIVHVKTNGVSEAVALDATGVVVIPLAVTSEVFDVKILLDNLVYEDDQTGLIVTVTNNGAGSAAIGLAVISDQGRFG